MNKRLSFSGRGRTVSGSAWALAAWACSTLPVLGGDSGRLDEIIDASETIFVAHVSDKSTAFRRGNIVTTYHLWVREVWKGSPPADRDGRFDLEMLGGSLTGPVPLAQVVSSSAHMNPGDEVLLFARTYVLPEPSRKAGVQPVYSDGNLVLTSESIGRLSILTDERDGERYVVRHASNAQIGAPNDVAIRRSLSAQQRRLQRALQARASSSRPSRTPLGERQKIHDFERLSDVREYVIRRERRVRNLQQ